MKKWMVVAGCLVLFEAILVWQVRHTEKPAEPLLATTGPTPTEQQILDTARKKAPKPVGRLLAPIEKTADAPKKLDPKSDEFVERVDEVYPRRMYANAAKCWHGEFTGQNKNFKAKFAFKLRIVGGKVQIAEAKMLDSTFGDRSLERCFLEAIRASAWQDDEMPDYEQDDELLIRVRGLKKYLQEDDDGPDEDIIPASTATP